jgi:polar amino acid transport system substrate-binding protein
LLRDVAANFSRKLSLSPEEKNYLVQKKKILMCVDPEWFPFEAIREGKHVGIAADVMRRFEKELNMPIELVPTESWDETLRYGQTRKCDIFSLASNTPTRAEYMDFTSPYVTLPIVMATTLEKPFTDEITSLKGKKLGAVKGYSITEQLKTTYPELTLIEVMTIKEGLSMVERGELYGYIDNLMVVSNYIQKEYTGQLKVSMRLEDNKVELAVGTRNDEPHLNAIFEKLVQNLDEMSMQEIYNRWVSTVEEVPWIDKKVIMWSIGFFLLVVAAFLWRQLIISRYNQKLLKLSITDKLTELYNRQKTDHRLIEEEAKVARYDDYHCALMMIDVDHFKKINDTLGHQAGDEVLIKLAGLLKNHFRQSDIIGRWGGEEFMVILPHTSLSEACHVAEQFRKEVENHSFEIAMPITVSIGVGELIRGEGIHEGVAAIDRALYRAKSEGRNRICSL